MSDTNTTDALPAVRRSFTIHASRVIPSTTMFDEPQIVVAGIDHDLGLLVTSFSIVPANSLLAGHPVYSRPIGDSYPGAPKEFGDKGENGPRRILGYFRVERDGDNMCFHAIPADMEERTKAEMLTAAVDCGNPGCTGTMHYVDTPESDWAHSLPTASFETVNVDLWRETANEWRADVDGIIEVTMSAQELRAMADLYTSFPGWLRHQADRLEALNKVTQ